MLEKEDNSITGSNTVKKCKEKEWGCIYKKGLLYAVQDFWGVPGKSRLFLSCLLKEVMFDIW